MIELEDLSKKFNLQDHDLLDKITESLNQKIIGETNNKKIIFLVCLTKDLQRDERLSLIISSVSSAGKSNLLNSVLEIFKKDVIDFTEFTSAYFHRKMGNLNGKILKFEQMEKTNQRGQVTMSFLKHQLSEGKTKMGLVDRDEDGKWSTKELEVNGIPVYISTTTNPNIDSETLNRMILMQIDETEIQTEKITSFTLNKYSSPRVNDTWQNELKELRKLVTYYQELGKETTEILIPFAKKLEGKFPKNTEIRRDLKFILNLTKAIAFCHSANRKRVRDNNGESQILDQFAKTEKVYRYSLIAELDDFKEALEIGKDIFSQTLNKLNKSTMEIITHARDLDKEGLGFTSSDMARVSGLSQNRAREKINQGLEAGFFTREGNKPITYKLTKKKLEVLSIDGIKFTDLEFKKWFTESYSKYNGRFEISFPHTTSDLLRTNLSKSHEK